MTRRGNFPDRIQRWQGRSYLYAIKTGLNKNVGQNEFMVSGTEIATNTGTNVCDDHAKWHIFHKETLSLANTILVFQVDRYRGSLQLCLFAYLLSPARIIWVQDF